MPNLEIKLLGGFEVKLDDQPADFRTDALRVLLAYLASHQGRPLRRDTLAGLLSPDRPDKEALTYLRNRLTRLRQTIKDDSAIPPWFDIDRKQITLRTGDGVKVDGVRVDVAEFERLVGVVESHPHRTLAGCPSCLADLQTAVDLVRGEFLAGLNFPSDTWEAWLLTQREHFQQRSLKALADLCRAKVELGAWEEALALGQRQVQVEPWAEEAHRAIMLAHYHLGDRNAALTQYEACAAHLWDELGVEPEDETNDLHEQIARGILNVQETSGIPDNLPLQTGQFIGRESEQALLLKRLVDPNHRLMTIIGPGGIGKTRLSLEVGSRVKNSFPDGVWFVPLDAVNGGAEQIKIAVGEALGLGQGDKQLSGDQVIAILRGKQVLLIFDNSESKLEDLAFMSDWLKRAPNMAILATSREPLNFQLESTVSLKGLPLGEAEQDGVSAAEGLFEERGQMARDDFEITAENRPDVREICELVDGSPLGIGLAAAWVRRRSLAQIVQSIHKSLDFLSTRMRDIDKRHQSMRAVFETSWEMLTEDEQAVLAALALFPATFSAEAAVQISKSSIWDLDGLCDKSLLNQQQEAERYSMHGLVRQFAAEKLGDKRPEVERGFVDYYFRFATLNREDYAELRPEWQNLRSVADYQFGLEDAEGLLNLTDVLHDSWFRFGRFHEANQIYELAELAAKKLGSEKRLIQTLIRWAEIGLEQSQYDSVWEQLETALPIAYQLEDDSAVAQIKYLQAFILLDQAEYDLAEKMLLESISILNPEQDTLFQGKAYDLLGWLYFEFDDSTNRSSEAASRANKLFGKCGELFEKISTFRLQANIAYKNGDLESAKDFANEALKAAVETDSASERMASLYSLLAICVGREEFTEGMDFAQAGLKIARSIGNLRYQGLIQHEMSAILIRTGEYERAKLITEQNLNLFEEIQDRRNFGFSTRQMGDIYAKLDDEKQSLLFWDKAKNIALHTQNDVLLNQVESRIGHQS